MNDNLTQAPDRQARRYRSLLEVAEVISLRRDLHELFRDLAQRLPAVVYVNYVALSLYDPDRNLMRHHTLQANVPADSQGPTLFVPLTELKFSTEAAPPHRVSTLESAEREHILRILNETNWVIAGPFGAAARLGMKRTTLQHKMKKLNVSRPS